MLDLLQQFADWIWAGIEWLTGWTPGEHIKNVLEWIGAILGVIGGAFTLLAYIRGRGAATKADISEVSEEIEALRAEYRAQMARMQSALGGGDAALTGAGAQAPGDGLGADLDAGIDTLLKAGRADALRDKSGEAAQTAIEELIAERARARERIAADEAALYRQKGAFAFLHDTHAAMAAYARAVELDPDDPAGWNRLGQLQLRTGALDAAIDSFERVLALGNTLADKEWEAIATGNLGLIYQTRGELDRAEAMFLRSLEISDANGMKELSANQNGNLGSLYQERGDTARACQHWARARDLWREIGNPDMVAKNEGRMRDAGCPED